MRHLLAGFGMALALPWAPAMAQDDGMIAMCLARGETQPVCECAASAAQASLGGRYGQMQQVGAAFARILGQGGGVAAAWSGALDEVGLGRIEAGPFADAYRDSVIGCGGKG